MNTSENLVWQVNAVGNFAQLKTWADAQEQHEDPLWLCLSVFEENLPEGRLQILFTDETAARVFTRNHTLGNNFIVECTPLESENWIAKSLEGLPVVHAGRFYLYGAHHDGPDDASVIPILIEAGEAFGTGHHGTTKGCLLAFDDCLATVAPTSVLDLGTGTGMLAIAVAKVLPGAKILATDIDPIAVNVAAANANINGVGERIDLVVADGFSHDALKGQQFELIFANILANPLITLASEISGALAPSGTLILSGILDTQASQVRGAYEAQHINFIQEYALDEWRVLVMKAPD